MTTTAVNTIPDSCALFAVVPEWLPNIAFHSWHNDKMQKHGETTHVDQDYRHESACAKSRLSLLTRACKRFCRLTYCVFMRRATHILHLLLIFDLLLCTPGLSIAVLHHTASWHSFKGGSITTKGHDDNGCEHYT